MTETKARRAAGRPRAFDTDAALDKAVRLFWQRGYEATSMADLVAETGVAAASLYAAFGNKAGLFAAVIERYAATFSVHLYAPIDDPSLSTYEAVKGLLERAASSFSEPGTPAGCFMYSAAAAVSPASAAIECLLRDKRIAAEALLIERLRRGAEVVGEVDRVRARFGDEQLLSDDDARERDIGPRRDRERHRLPPLPLVVGGDLRRELGTDGAGEIGAEPEVLRHDARRRVVDAGADDRVAERLREQVGAHAVDEHLQLRGIPLHLCRIQRLLRDRDGALRALLDATLTASRDRNAALAAAARG